jgi:hypothetical protein
VSYKAINTDEDGLPMLPENPIFLDALESYIKMKRFRILFDQQKIPMNIYQIAKAEYTDAARACHGMFATPSESEMESITSMMHQLIPRLNEFQSGFKNIGDKEYTRFK